MGEVISLWPLTGIAVIVVGFLLRFNPVLVVIIAGIVTGLAAHMPIATILEKLGEGFLNTRNLPFILLIPLIYILPQILRADKTTAIYMAEPVADFLAVSFTVVLFTFQFKKVLAQMAGDEKRDKGIRSQTE